MYTKIILLAATAILISGCDISPADKKVPESTPVIEKQATPTSAPAKTEKDFTEKTIDLANSIKEKVSTEAVKAKAYAVEKSNISIAKTKEFMASVEKKGYEYVADFEIDQLNKKGSADNAKLAKKNAQVKKIQDEEIAYFKANPTESPNVKQANFKTRTQSKQNVVVKNKTKVVEKIKTNFVAGSETIEELNAIGDAENDEIKRKNELNKAFR